MIQGNRAYAHAGETFAPAHRAPSTGVAQFSYPSIFAAKPRRGLGSTLRDLSLVVLGWMFFVGVIVYPAAYLMGLAVCAIALLALPSEQSAA
jgi:hypothetical protein